MTSREATGRAGEKTKRLGLDWPQAEETRRGYSIPLSGRGVTLVIVKYRKYNTGTCNNIISFLSDPFGLGNACVKKKSDR